MKSYRVTIKINAIEHYITVVLFFFLLNSVVTTLESVDDTLLTAFNVQVHTSYYQDIYIFT